MAARRVLLECTFRQAHGYPCDPLHPALEQLCTACREAYGPMTEVQRRRLHVWLAKVVRRR